MRFGIASASGVPGLRRAVNMAKLRPNSSSFLCIPDAPRRYASAPMPERDPSFAPPSRKPARALPLAAFPSGPSWSTGEIIGRGHNQRVQHGSVIHHAEMNCLENAGRLPARVYAECILYSTLSPCPMCSGAALLYKIPRIVIGENVTFQGPEDYVRCQGVKLEIMPGRRVHPIDARFHRRPPELWNEDIGV